jgi:histone deacetylase 1/2
VYATYLIFYLTLSKLVRPLIVLSFNSPKPTKGLDALSTRSDISFVVSKLSQFVSNPRDNHWRALEKAMHYLKGTMNYGIHYIGYPKMLEGYCDMNWISDADEVHAISGYVLLLRGGTVSWKPCK